LRRPEPTAPASQIGNPAPLGLLAFGITTSESFFEVAPGRGGCGCVCERRLFAHHAYVQCESAARRQSTWLLGRERCERRLKRARTCLGCWVDSPA
jgi:hypothetical protein